MTEQGPVESRVPGITDEDLWPVRLVWVGMLSAVAGVLLGAALAFSQPDGASSSGRSLLGLAVVVISTALGALVYLVGKVLERQ
ncbi:hypothetical protein H9L10_12855 [Phycicoccus endophyticus]|uniref:Uncharacterized protein n=1 Tax=Phycicoccus endophyticus TaxID=1690220 RepID=A0A7G9R0I5_9MICO|nr:hypothetical protein [Phycicoccus endophyticus]NHI19387.1 hypothetical protein [Phycicoccus endophyticus]QNN49110.1 hypothetical protein H9L10_12855 [Phycicoccus endophyticus]